MFPEQHQISMTLKTGVMAADITALPSQELITFENIIK